MLRRNVWMRGAIVGGAVLSGAYAMSLAGAGPTAWAQEPATVTATENPPPDRSPAATPRTLDEAVEALAATDWATRDAAEHWLLRQPAVIRSDIEQKLDETTDPEVASRLEDVALHLYLKSLTPLHGKASMLGISLGLEPVRLGAKGEDVRMAVAVMALQPGFPAAEVLRVGDRVVGMAGQPFGLDMTVENFRSRINALAPGDTIELTVRRGKDELKLPVTLAGVPDEGVAAMSNYMDHRLHQAALYTALLVDKIRQHQQQQGQHGLTFKVQPSAAKPDPADDIWTTK